MHHAVKISAAEMAELREAAKLQSRSLSGQAEHWLRLGRAVERDPRFGYTKVEQALKGLIAPVELNENEQKEYFDKFADNLWEPSAKEDAFFADMQRRGVGFVMDEAGNIVRASPPPKK